MKILRTTRLITLSAMFLAIGLLLPFVTGQIPQIGKMLCPMHIPVLLCGLVCGWQLGLVVGFITPLLRGVLFGMPVLYPTGLAMAFELAAYGAIIGALYGRFRKQNIGVVYFCMIVAMLLGRIVWGVVDAILLGLGGSSLTWSVFVSSAFVNAIPGIILQLILIPAIMAALNHTGLMRFKGKQKEKK